MCNPFALISTGVQVAGAISSKKAADKAAAAALRAGEFNASIIERDIDLFERQRGIIEMIVYSIIAIMAIFIGAIYFQNDMQLGSKLIQFSFIGIAALTVPHMLLVDYGAVSKMRFAKW